MKKLLKKFQEYYKSLSARTKDSIKLSFYLVGFISTILSILGISFNNLFTSNILVNFVILLFLIFILTFLIYLLIGNLSQDSITLAIRNTSIRILYGDIFEIDGLKVIPCDTHFDNRIDDIHISKTSLHGQLFLSHANTTDIEIAVNDKAKEIGIQKNNNGLFTFPIGTIIKFNSNLDGNTYLMLAMTELNKDNRAFTNRTKHVDMLIKMWNEIDIVYARNNIVLPILGSGITRFEDGPIDDDTLLKFMLYTLNASAVNFKSIINIAIFNNNDMDLYDYKYI